MTAISDLQKVYIGYFGRAADPSGLNYWVGRYNAGMSLVDIASSFAVQDESTALYQYLALPGLGIGVEQFLNSVYLNLFNRELDSEGLIYWSGELANGKPIGRVIIDIISGAQGNDAVIVANKVAVASYYTSEVVSRGDVWGDDLRDDLADARAVLAGVTADAATVASGKSTADALITLDMNRAPTASAAQLAAVEDGAVLSGNLRADGFAADADNNPLTFSLVSGAAGFSLAANGDWVFDPSAAAYQGLKAGQVVSVTATYRVSDGVATAQNVVTFAVTGTNDAPVAQALTVGGVEGAVVTGQVAASDVDGDALSYALVSATGGAVSLNPQTGAFSFTPMPGFSGNGAFIYTVSDGKGAISDPQTVTVAVARAASYSLTVDAPVVVEGDAGVRELTFTLRLDRAPTIDVVVNYASSGGSAVSGPVWAAQGAEDYPSVSGAVLFRVGQTNAQISIPIYGDERDEANETVELTFTGERLVSSVTVAGTIIDDDASPAFTSAAAVSIPERTTAVTTVSAADADTASNGDVVTYAIVGGDDAALFTVNAQSGVLALKAPANYEQPADAGVNNAYSVVVRASDGKGNHTDQTLSVTVTDVNEAPTAVVLANAVALRAENSPSGAAVKVADVAISDDAITAGNVVTLSGTDAGSFEVVGGALYLKAGVALNYEVKSSYSVTVTVSDAGAVGGGPVSTSYTLSVDDVNEAPTLAPIAPVATAEDTAVTVTAVGADVDGGDALTYAAGPAAKGTVTGGAGGVFTYTPDADANGSDSFTVTVTDRDGLSASQTVSVAVDPVNDAPVAAATQAKSTAEDASVTVSVVASDVDGDQLTYTVTSAPAHGTVTGGQGGVFTYAPRADYNGVDSFTVSISDGKGATIQQVVGVTVNAVDDAPRPVADGPIFVVTGQTVTIDALANDVEADGQALSIASATVTSGQGTVAVVDGRLVFTGQPGYQGPATITYGASDGISVVQSTVTLTVSEPVISTTKGVYAEGEAVALTVSGIPNLVYEVDVTTRGVTTRERVQTDGSGRVDIVIANPADRTTDGNQVVTAKIVGTLGAATTITITDTSKDNAAPQTPGASVQVSEDGSASGTLVATDVDPEDQGNLTFAATSALPAGVTLSSDGRYAVDATGAAYQDLAGGATRVLTVNYEVSDNAAVGRLGALTGTGVLQVTVAGVNDAPTTAATQATSTNEDVAKLVTISASDIDVGDVLGYVVTAGPANGSVVAGPLANQFVYTPNVNYNGSDSFTVTVSDGKGGSVAQVVNVAVGAVNDLPVPVAGAIAADEAGPVKTGQLVASDIDGDALTFSQTSAIAGLTINPNGQFSFDPTLNPAAQALTYTSQPLVLTAGYQVDDGNGGVVPSELTITVTPTPLTFRLEAVEPVSIEGEVATFRVVASEAVQSAYLVSFQLVAGGAGAADFAPSSFNPVTVTIAPGSTTATFQVLPLSDETAELPESYSVQATITGAVAASVDAVAGAVLDSPDQTLRLTVSDTDNVQAGLGNDLIIGARSNTITSSGTASTYNPGDVVNGGGGTNTLRLFMDQGAIADGVAVSNVQRLDLRLNASSSTEAADAQLVMTDWDANLQRIDILSNKSRLQITEQKTLADVTIRDLSTADQASSYEFQYAAGVVDGSDDVLKLGLDNVNGEDGADVVLDSGIEGVQIAVNDRVGTQANPDRYSSDVNLHASGVGTIAVTGGRAGQTFNLDADVATGADLDSTEFAGNIHLTSGDIRTVHLGAGNDKVVISGQAGASGSSYNLGDGDNQFGYDGALGGQVIAGSGADAVTVGSTAATSSIDVGGGGNQVTVSADHAGAISAADGDNRVQVTGNVEGDATITLGDGDNVVRVQDEVQDESVISLGDGDNRVFVKDGIEHDATVSFGDGDNGLTVFEDVEDRAAISFGNGNNTLKVLSEVKHDATVQFGDGNNLVEIGGAITTDEEPDSEGVTMTLGHGDNVVVVGGSIRNQVISLSHTLPSESSSYELATQSGATYRVNYDSTGATLQTQVTLQKKAAGGAIFEAVALTTSSTAAFLAAVAQELGAVDVRFFSSATELMTIWSGVDYDKVVSAHRVTPGTSTRITSTTLSIVDDQFVPTSAGSTNDDVIDGTITFGDGTNFMRVDGDVQASRIEFGDGEGNQLIVGGDVLAEVPTSIVFGDGDGNELTIGGSLVGDDVVFGTGSGNTVTVGGDVRDGALITVLGNATTLTVDGSVSGATITLGGGSNIGLIKGDVTSGSTVTFGSGADDLTLGASPSFNWPEVNGAGAATVIDMGGGDDQVTILPRQLVIGANPSTSRLSYDITPADDGVTTPFTDLLAEPPGTSTSAPYVRPGHRVAGATLVESFAPDVEIAVPDTFNGTGDDEVDNQQVEIYHGTYDAVTGIFTVTMTPSVPGPGGYPPTPVDAPTHTLALYDNDPSGYVKYIEGLVFEGFYEEQGFVVSGPSGSRVLKFDSSHLISKYVFIDDSWIEYTVPPVYVPFGGGEADVAVADDLTSLVQSGGFVDGDQGDDTLTLETGETVNALIARTDAQVVEIDFTGQTYVLGDVITVTFSRGGQAFSVTHTVNAGDFIQGADNLASSVANSVAAKLNANTTFQPIFGAGATDGVVNITSDNAHEDFAITSTRGVVDVVQISDTRITSFETLELTVLDSTGTNDITIGADFDLIEGTDRVVLDSQLERNETVGALSNGRYSTFSEGGLSTFNLDNLKGGEAISVAGHESSATGNRQATRITVNNNNDDHLVGDKIIVTIGDVEVTYTVTAADLNAATSQLDANKIATSLASAIASAAAAAGMTVARDANVLTLVGQPGVVVPVEVDHTRMVEATVVDLTGDNRVTQWDVGNALALPLEPGDVISITVDGETATYTVTSEDCLRLEGNAITAHFADALAAASGAWSVLSFDELASVTVTRMVDQADPDQTFPTLVQSSTATDDHVADVVVAASLAAEHDTDDDTMSLTVDGHGDFDLAITPVGEDQGTYEHLELNIADGHSHYINTGGDEGNFTHGITLTGGSAGETIYLDAVAAREVSAVSPANITIDQYSGVRSVAPADFAGETINVTTGAGDDRLVTLAQSAMAEGSSIDLGAGRGTLALGWGDGVVLNLIQDELIPWGWSIGDGRSKDKFFNQPEMAVGTQVQAEMHLPSASPIGPQTWGDEDSFRVLLTAGKTYQLSIGGVETGSTPKALEIMVWSKSLLDGLQGSDHLGPQGWTGQSAFAFASVYNPGFDTSNGPRDTGNGPLTNGQNQHIFTQNAVYESTSLLALQVTPVVDAWVNFYVYDESGSGRFAAEVFENNGDIRESLQYNTPTQVFEVEDGAAPSPLDFSSMNFSGTLTELEVQNRVVAYDDMEIVMPGGADDVEALILADFESPGANDLTVVGAANDFRIEADEDFDLGAGGDRFGSLTLTNAARQRTNGDLTVQVGGVARFALGNAALASLFVSAGVSAEVAIADNSDGTVSIGDVVLEHVGEDGGDDNQLLVINNEDTAVTVGSLSVSGQIDTDLEVEDNDGLSFTIGDVTLHSGDDADIFLEDNSDSSLTLGNVVIQTVYDYGEYASVEINGNDNTSVTLASIRIDAGSYGVVEVNDNYRSTVVVTGDVSISSEWQATLEIAGNSETDVSLAVGGEVSLISCDDNVLLRIAENQNFTSFVSDPDARDGYDHAILLGDVLLDAATDADLLVQDNLDNTNEDDMLIQMGDVDAIAAEDVNISIGWDSPGISASDIVGEDGGNYAATVMMDDVSATAGENAFFSVSGNDGVYYETFRYTYGFSPEPTYEADFTDVWARDVTLNADASAGIAIVMNSLTSVSLAWGADEAVTIDAGEDSYLEISSNLGFVASLGETSLTAGGAAHVGINNNQGAGVLPGGVVNPVGAEDFVLDGYSLVVIDELSVSGTYLAEVDIRDNDLTQIVIEDGLSIQGEDANLTIWGNDDVAVLVGTGFDGPDDWSPSDVSISGEDAGFSIENNVDTAVYAGSVSIDGSSEEEGDASLWIDTNGNISVLFGDVEVTASETATVYVYDNDVSDIRLASLVASAAPAGEDDVAGDVNVTFDDNDDSTVEITGDVTLTSGVVGSGASAQSDWTAPDIQDGGDVSLRVDDNDYYSLIRLGHDGSVAATVTLQASDTATLSIYDNDGTQVQLGNVVIDAGDDVSVSIDENDDSGQDAEVEVGTLTVGAGDDVDVYIDSEDDNHIQVGDVAVDAGNDVNFEAYGWGEDSDVTIGDIHIMAGLSQHGLEDGDGGFNRAYVNFDLEDVAGAENVVIDASASVDSLMEVYAYDTPDMATLTLSGTHADVRLGGSMGGTGASSNRFTLDLSGLTGSFSAGADDHDDRFDYGTYGDGASDGVWVETWDADFSGDGGAPGLVTVKIGSSDLVYNATHTNHISDSEPFNAGDDWWGQEGWYSLGGGRDLTPERAYQEILYYGFDWGWDGLDTDEGYDDTLQLDFESGNSYEFTWNEDDFDEDDEFWSWLQYVASEEGFAYVDNDWSWLDLQGLADGTDFTPVSTANMSYEIAWYDDDDGWGNWEYMTESQNVYIEYTPGVPATDGQGQIAREIFQFTGDTVGEVVIGGFNPGEWGYASPVNGRPVDRLDWSHFDWNGNGIDDDAGLVNLGDFSFTLERSTYSEGDGYFDDVVIDFIGGESLELADIAFGSVRLVGVGEIDDAISRVADSMHFG